MQSWPLQREARHSAQYTFEEGLARMFCRDLDAFLAMLLVREVGRGLSFPFEFGLDVVNPSANDMVPYLSLPESLIAIGTPRMSAMGHQVMNWHVSKKANIVT